VRVVPAEGGPDDLRRLLTALDAALTDDAAPAVAVVPTRPPAWQATVRRALVPERPADGALLLVTSGSTGRPTGVVLPAPALRHSAASMTERLGGPGSWLLALPLTHVAGAMVVARALLSGTSVVAAVGGPDRFVDAAGTLPGPRRYVSLVPTQLRRLLRAGDRARAALASFDAVLVGGAALPAALGRAAREAGVAVVESYGMTETCGGCVVDGRPLRGVDVRLDGDGRVAVAGPVLAAARRTPDDDVPLTVDGWYQTQDVGQWDGAVLQVRGRVDDVVLSGGVTVPLAAVDGILAEHPDLADVAVVGIPDEEWGTKVVALAVPSDPERPPTLAQVRAFVAARAEPGYVPADLRLVQRLPRPAPGKLDRAALARLVGEG
jgi:O-succinylbenzoic acid--CoA ligase